MLTRRDFHTHLAATALATVAGVPSVGRAAASGEARLYLNRLTFGATPQSAAEFEAMGRDAWLDAQLAQPSTDPAIEARLGRARLRIEYEAGKSDTGAEYGPLDELRRYQYRDHDPAERLKFMDFDLPIDWQERIRPADEVIHAALIRACHAQAQLAEVMTQFWHEHFSVNAMKDETTAIFFPEHDAIMRRHALGNFRALLGKVARSPSMLYYLNNEASRASPANENYARELLELHTLGAEHYFNHLYDDWRAVPGATEGMAQGYIDQDVYEVARAFTGWSVGDGRYVEDGTFAPETGRFAYIEAWHDPYQKRVLGHEFRPNRGPMEDGEQVLDLLAAHPGTARFVSGKIVRALGLEAASEDLRLRVAAVFHANRDEDDQIARTVRAVVTDPEFAATPPQKLRRPFEFLAALYRISGGEVITTNFRHNWYLSRAGWTQHEVRPPTGHSDASTDWANTRCLNGMADLALYAHDDWFETVEADLADRLGVASWGEFAQAWAARFGLAGDAFVEELGFVHVAAGDPISDDPEHVAWAAKTFLSLGAMTPAHMFR